ncbi:MAG: lipoate--protein ligase family protein [Nesterenkonia sp.]|nr:lipoate--protein ligase family protein [Nesterenkonia sp.]
MIAGQLAVLRQDRTLGAAADLQAAVTLLQGTRSGETPAMLRLYRPEPTVAFGQRDRRLPGFDEAAEACRRRGFTPLVRRAGGRAAAYHHGCLVVDHIQPDDDPVIDSQGRFSFLGEVLRRALEESGVDARIGELPGEYCPGEHTIHGVAAGEPDRRVKLIGSAQRVIGTGWLFSSAIIVEDSSPIRGVLSEAYEALDMEWDPLTAGSAQDLVEEVTVEQVAEAVLDAYSEHTDLAPAAPELLDV